VQPWQFNVLFSIAALGAVFLLVGPALGIDIQATPTTLSGYGAILAYVLGHRSFFLKRDKEESKHRHKEKGDE
jgi:hypothetical protein